MQPCVMNKSTARSLRLETILCICSTSQRAWAQPEKAPQGTTYSQSPTGLLAGSAEQAQPPGDL